MRYGLWIVLFSLTALSAGLWVNFSGLLPSFSPESKVSTPQLSLVANPAPSVPKTVTTQNKKPTAPVPTTEQKLFEALQIILNRKVFGDWDFELLADATIRVGSKTAHFQSGFVPGDSFQRFLTKFSPLYLELLNQPDYKDKVEHVVIESHTSSVWQGVTDEAEKFQKNLVLSRHRARGVERHIQQIPGLSHLKHWMDLKIRSTGMSFGRQIRLPGGKEDKEKSTRIEFRVDFSDR